MVHGSSAGGMLCVLAAKYFDYGDPSAADPVERMSCRPDGAMPAYGVFVSANQRGKGGLGSPYTDEDRKEIIFPHAPHGIGLANGDGTRYNNPHVAHWYELSVEWLKESIGF